MSLPANSVTREGMPPALIALMAHAVAVTLLLLAARALPASQITALPWPWFEAAIALALGYAAGLPRWWWPINLLFVPALAAAWGMHLPPSLFLLGFAFLFACNAAAWRERVPLFLSNALAAQQVVRLLPVQSGVKVLDLGCGTGTLLSALAQARPEGEYHGIEIAPLTYLIARYRAWRSPGTCVVRWANFWHADWSDYDVVYAYLSPQPMARLWRKAHREMRAGSVLISNGFDIPGVEPTCVIATGDRLAPALYVWRM